MTPAYRSGLRPFQSDDCSNAWAILKIVSSLSGPASI